jgi:hypothetical protein
MKEDNGPFLYALVCATAWGAWKMADDTSLSAQGMMASKSRKDHLFRAYRLMPEPTGKGVEEL